MGQKSTSFLSKPFLEMTNDIFLNKKNDLNKVKQYDYFKTWQYTYILSYLVLRYVKIL